MVSILINVIQHEQYFFSFQEQVSAVYSFISKSCCIMLKSHVSSLGNNKCDKAKGQCWRWLIYAQGNFLLHNMLRVSRSNNCCSWTFYKFHRKIPVLKSLFFLKMMKLYKGICSAWISLNTSAEFSFS